MALKDTWKDLQNAIEGVPNSGDDINADDINNIAHAVIDLEEAPVADKLAKVATSGSYKDLTDKPEILGEDDVKYIHRNYTYPVLRAESDDEGNKIRFTYARKDEVQNNLNIVHDIMNLEGDAEIDAIPDARAVKVYCSYIQTHIVNYVDRAIGDIETSLENIIKKYGLGGDEV